MHSSIDLAGEAVEQYVGGGGGGGSGCVQIALLLPAGPEMTVASTSTAL